MVGFGTTSFLHVLLIYRLLIPASSVACLMTLESCVSKCVFDATKPPPVGASKERLEENGMKSRVDIIRECRPKCAKTSEQLLLGQPKAGKSPTAAAPIQE